MTVAAAARTVRAGGDAPPGAPPGGSRLRLVLSSFLMPFTVLARGARVTVQRSSEQLIFFGAGSATSGVPAWIVLPAIFLGVAAVMTCIGEGVARSFVRFPPLEAYRLDILGSLGGIIAFSALSFLWAPPLAWGAVVAVVFAVLQGTRRRLILAAAMLAMLGVLAVETFTPRF